MGLGSELQVRLGMVGDLRLEMVRSAVGVHMLVVSGERLRVRDPPKMGGAELPLDAGIGVRVGGAPRRLPQIFQSSPWPLFPVIQL